MRFCTSFAFLLCGATITLTGCDVDGRAPDEPEAISTHASAIKGGYTDTTDTAVVGVVDITGALCSGSLLLPNMVLTARHCVSDTLNEVQGGVDCSVTKPGPPHAASQFYVTTKQSMTQNPNDYYPVTEVLTVPSSNGLFCGNDQAILILGKSIPDTEAVPLVPRVDSALAKGEGYYAIGYGATNDSGAGAGSRRRLDNLFVNCAEDGCKGLSAYVKVTEWVGDTGICEGDSGGPALDLQNRVVGVTSRGGPNCTSPVYGAVHGWGQWIMDSANHAAEVGGYAPPPWASGYPTDPVYNYPIGGVCDDTCVSDLCLADECTRYCTETAVCPDNYDCVPVDDFYSACQKHAVPPKKKKPVVTETSCALSPDRDPTNPVPWFGAVAVALGAAVVRKVSRKRR